MFDSKESIARRRAWLLLIVASIIGIVFPKLLHFSVDLSSFYSLYVLAATFALFLPYTRWRKLAPIQAALECLVINFCAVAPILTLSYSAMRINFPLADQRLGAMDSAIGWSSASFVEFMQHYPRFGQILSHAYDELLPQTILLPFILAFTGRIERSYQLVGGYIAVNVIAFICSAPFPSHGALVGQGVDPRHLQHLNLGETLGFIKSLEDARNSSHFVLSVDTASGIITFPSIHAAMAALFIWAIWPVRFVRYPVIALNVLMMLSALTCGGHYLVDVIAGNIVVLIAVTIITSKHLPNVEIWADSRITKWFKLSTMSI